jgi:hypothetical protein
VEPIAWGYRSVVRLEKGLLGLARFHHPNPSDAIGTSWPKRRAVLCRARLPRSSQFSCRSDGWYLRALNKVGSYEASIVDNFAANFAFLRFLSYHFATVRFLYRSLCLLFFAGLLGGAAAAADVPSVPVHSFAPDLSFSVADFDGDSRPDLATIQAGKSDSFRTNYWIQLQLSAAGRQTFQIVAPFGGLQIASRDVNGDNAPDLVLTTTWLGQPVAILLNDGHGNFSRVEPAAFPEAFSQSKPSWGFTTDRAIDAVGAPPQPREDLCSETDLFLHLRSESRFAASSDPRFSIGRFLISHLGRAPPLEASHF